MRWFTSRACKTLGSAFWRFQLWVNYEKWQRFWLAIALKKSTDMSLIGYIAQHCKNTLDSFPDLLIVFAFVWGYLAPSSTPYNQALADIRDSMTDDIRGGNCPPCPPLMSSMGGTVHRCHGSVRISVRGSRFDTISVQHEKKKEIYYARFLFIYFEQTVVQTEKKSI